MPTRQQWVSGAKKTERIVTNQQRYQRSRLPWFGFADRHSEGLAHLVWWRCQEQHYVTCEENYRKTLDTISTPLKIVRGGSEKKREGQTKSKR